MSFGHIGDWTGGVSAEAGEETEAVGGGGFYAGAVLCWGCEAGRGGSRSTSAAGRGFADDTDSSVVATSIVFLLAPTCTLCQ